MKSMLIALALACSSLPAPALALDPTPVPAACNTLAACVDSGVFSAINNCVDNSLGCVVNSRDSLAISANQLAARAVTVNKCAETTKRKRCNACYREAKLPLKSRYDQKLFHGLLARAGALIEQERLARCLALP
jgi:hypothetical protein